MQRSSCFGHALLLSDRHMHQSRYEDRIQPVN
jgi:hypothetical protein